MSRTSDYTSHTCRPRLPSVSPDITAARLAATITQMHANPIQITFSPNLSDGFAEKLAKAKPMR